MGAARAWELNYRDRLCRLVFNGARRHTTIGVEGRDDGPGPPAAKGCRPARQGARPPAGHAPVVGWERAPDDADARHPGRDRPARAGRHHGRHPELQERRDDRLRGPGGARRARPVLPGAQARPRQLRRRQPRRHPARRHRDRAAGLRRVDPPRPARPTGSTGSRITYPEIDGVGGKGAALRTIFEIAAALEVQALVVVDSDLRSIVPEWIELLAGPILKGGYDFVAPLYARYKYDGTITNTVTYPLTRALYGHRIRQPIGGDFGVSGDLVRHYLELDDWTDDISKFGIDIWMTTSALTGGFAVCQARLGAKVHDPKDPGSDLGPMFRQVVGTILRLAAAHPDAWLDVARQPRRPGLRLRADHRPAAARGERDPPPVRVPRGLADRRRHVAPDARPGEPRRRC